MMDNNKRTNLLNEFYPVSLMNNEADVEVGFVEPLLHRLGYLPQIIKRKNSLSEFNCGIGSKKLPYKPDYIITDNKNIPLLVIDAKAPNENLEKHLNQCSSYCFHLNKINETVKYFILTNGIRTILYDWKGLNKILEISHDDIVNGKPNYQNLVNTLNLRELTQDSNPTKNSDLLIIKKISKENAQKIFKTCHKTIWNAEKIGVNAAFMEFIKLIFLKLESDKKIHAKYKYEKGDTMKVKKEDVLFSEHWIDAHSSDMQKNPIKEIQFRNLMEELNALIKKNKKKALFEKDETIKLKANTIREIVKKLEKHDLYGIDEDLNGRLFETFLNATMRGNDLGQYFTPRSIVKLGVALADIKATKNHIDKVLDGSCGTGGFLIEAFAVMKNKILGMGNYSDKEKDDLIENVLAKQCIYGIDAAKDPKLARIARINMYLHGDGGSNIYMGDGLSKKMKADATDLEEFRDEMERMQNEFLPESFDVVITNPPFSMSLTMDKEQDKEILEDYELLSYGTSKKKSLRTGVMFLERYEGLLKKGGKLITVLDNTILNSPDMEYVRDYIREKFIIKAIVSLHGDAFQQSKARVKTSLVYLEKKKDNESQPDAFMTFSTKLGVDDMPITTLPSVINKARQEADEEIKRIITDFQKFENGEEGEWRISPSRLNTRLDVKFCIPFNGRFVEKWHNKGFGTRALSDIFDEVTDIFDPKEENETPFKILTIKYDGSSSIEEERIGEDINGKGYIVKEGNIVMSRMNAFYGAIGYITNEEDGAYASKSYIVLNPKNEIDGIYAWAVLRSTEIRADLLDSAIGMGRCTIKWEEIKDVRIPYIEDKNIRLEYVNRVKAAWQGIKSAKEELLNVKNNLGDLFDTESEASIYRFDANKPPK